MFCCEKNSFRLIFLQFLNRIAIAKYGIVRIERFIVTTAVSTRSMPDRIYDDEKETKPELNINELETQL